MSQDCGCKIGQKTVLNQTLNGSTYMAVENEIIFCPLHASAAQMREALEGLVSEVLEEYHDWDSPAMTNAKAALRGAK